MNAALQKNSYQLLLPGSPTSLAMIRWVVTRLATAAGLSIDDIDSVEMAVDEACANVLDHAYGGLDPKPPLHIEINTNDETFIIDIIDRGKTFDMSNYREPKFPEHWMEGHERGVGLYLIHQFMDDVQYEKLPNDRNRMRLVKRRSPVTSTDG